MFDIDFPAEPTVPTGTVLKPEATDQRRGPIPMAKAISENRELLTETGEAEFATIPPGLVAKGETLPGQKWTHRDGNGSGFFGGGPATFRSGDPCLFEILEEKSQAP